MNRFLRVCRFLRQQNMLSIDLVEHYLDNPHLLEVTQSMLFPSVQRKIKAFIALNMLKDKHVDCLSIVSHINLRSDMVIDNLTYLIRSGEVRRDIVGLSGAYVLTKSSF